MAGGEGKRLKPLTNVIPKPLLPVGEKPIIQLIVENMKMAGITNIFVSVNYKKELIKNFLKDGSRYGLSITYIEENAPTGTAGSLLFLPENFNDNLLVSNGDLICDVEYKKIFDLLGKYDLVIMGVEKNISMDFGVLHLNGSNELQSWEEKPNLKYVVNGGIYAISVNAIRFIKSRISGEKYIDMPSLWKMALKNGMKIGVYIHDGKWHDVGRIEDYMKLAKSGDG